MKGITEGGWADNLVGVLFLTLCLHMGRSFSSDLELTKLFVALTFGMIVVILILKWMSDISGMAISDSLSHKPFKKSKKMLAKWTDQSWQICTHIGFATFAW
jgi:hypothetical protein